MSTLSPSVPALRTEFGPAVERHLVSCGQTIVYVGRDRSHDVLAWLRDTPGQEFNYLTDVTAVDYRDPERPLEVVYQLRSLGRKADLRVRSRSARCTTYGGGRTGWNARCTTCSA
jgi:NADH-quinone oxidoreductase subunit C